MQRNDLLVWMDLEMTSLQDAHIDRIVEIAIVLTDAELNVVAEGPDLVIHADEKLFDRMDPDFAPVYERNGLKKLVAQSTLTTAEAEKQALAFLQSFVAPQSAPLCGNSIHMDRHFLRLQMSELERYLFYRCIDVSSIKELARRWAPAVYEEAKKRKSIQTHRAKDDTLESIEELRYYREHLFIH